MKYMNEYDLRRASACAAGRPRLASAVRFLADFRDEVNAHSDGWAYWPAPVRAARVLMELIEENVRGTEDIAEAQLRAALSPIKAFYTRVGYDAGMKFPAVRT